MVEGEGGELRKQAEINNNSQEVGGNWMMILPVLIVLAGLVGGSRTLALVLIVSWCFLLRFVLVFGKVNSLV